MLIVEKYTSAEIRARLESVDSLALSSSDLSATNHYCLSHQYQTCNWPMKQLWQCAKTAKPNFTPQRLFSLNTAEWTVLSHCPQRATALHE